MKLAPSQVRRAAAASLAAVAVIGVTGCSAINYQATTHQYSGSDGVRVDIDDVKFRHIAFVGAEEGGPARAIGTVNNGGVEDVEVEISADGQSHSFTVPAGQAVSLENDEEFIVEGFSGAPGSIHDVTLTVDGDTEDIGATVLDGVLPEYRALLPDGYDEAVVEHLEHGPDTWGSGAAHHDPDDDGH
ncbi:MULTISPECIES: hypothetical protein [unclassified Nesterenkonia]|uniref:hypothetical protein n=1 Tax=unclassified Nesterenkonia TaxID=2629769 RepID=UPI0008730B43|nr:MULTISPECIES: hypothetical protein [unclassified Nesterenkonia]MDS2171084.1 hypothetical protein [Nesterenkonia sp. CL21]OSM44111.1 hypothetical protein BCY76_004640 [Nesterenkonia sp. PF2B19]